KIIFITIATTFYSFNKLLCVGHHGRFGQWRVNAFEPLSFPFVAREAILLIKAFSGGKLLTGLFHGFTFKRSFSGLINTCDTQNTIVALGWLGHRIPIMIGCRYV